MTLKFYYILLIFKSMFNKMVVSLLLYLGKGKEMKIKKFIALLLTVLMVLSFAACGSDSGNESTAQETAPVEKDLPEGDYSDMGNGTMYIKTAGGSSEDGNVPVIYAADDLLLEQIGLEAWGFDGSILSYIYVDGMEISKEQLADTQTSIDLQGDNLKEGIHKVEVVQYENDDPSGTMLTYKMASYEIKAK